MQDYWDQFNETDEMFWLGVEQGIIAFAYWKDGEQHVGTSGKTLAQALAEVRTKQSQAAGARVREGIEKRRREAERDG